jgi:signal peptide peptidase SppA
MAAVNDARIGAIVFDVNSPGGSVTGVDELSKMIYDARGSKPIVAVANHLMASAAYWIGTAADELVVTPSGEVGSIGVFAAHQDVSAAMEKEGVKTTLISAGKYKTEGNPFEPLTDEAHASIQARVDDYYSMFTKAVARNRGVNVADVRGGFGEGRVVGAQQAVSLGMADRVATLDDVISGLTRRQRQGRSVAAEIDYRQRRARALGGV